MRKKLLIAGFILACAAPAWAKADSAGGVNGNGVSDGSWCVSPLPIMSPRYDDGHWAPCWASGDWR